MCDFSSFPGESEMRVRPGWLLGPQGGVVDKEASSPWGSPSAVQLRSEQVL